MSGACTDQTKRMAQLWFPSDWTSWISDGEEIFEVEGEVGKSGDDERLLFLEVFQRRTAPATF